MKLKELLVERISDREKFMEQFVKFVNSHSGSPPNDFDLKYDKYNRMLTISNDFEYYEFLAPH